MSAFHFLRPAWLLAALPPLLLLWLLWRRQVHGNPWRMLVSPALLPHLLLNAGRGARLPWVLLGLGWLLAVAALAGPTWERQPQTLYRASFDRVLVLDVSPSMAAADVSPTRLARARLAIRRLLSEGREGRNALVVFAGEPHIVVPLTEDVATIEALLPALSPGIMPTGGDRAAPALRRAGELLRRGGGGASAQVLLISDGVADPADSLNAVRALRASGVTVSVLGVGTAQGAPVPRTEGGFAADAQGAVSLARFEPSGLKALASAGGGHYLHLGEGKLAQLFTPGVDRNPEHAKASRGGPARWMEEGPWLLLPLLLLAAAGFRRGWLGLWLLVLLAPPQPAQAFSWKDLWLRPDQQASQLLHQGEAAAAARRFHDPKWRATAQYRAGDFAAAAKGFAGNDADSLYNKGNALARAGQLQAAKRAYEAALAAGGEHPDARFNRDLVERLLRQRKAQTGRKKEASRQPSRGTPAPQGTATRADGKAAQGKKNGNAAGAKPSTAANQAGPQQSGADGKQPAAAGQESAGAASATSQGRKPEQAASAATGSEPPASPVTAANKGDSAERARADVSATSAASGHETAATTTGQGASASAQMRPQQSSSPQSEQDLALQQWLRQVPDDPAGLLRRKFMLDHLRRQRGGDTP